MNVQCLRELFTGMDTERYAAHDICRATKWRFGVLTTRDNQALAIINGEIVHRERVALSW